MSYNQFCPIAKAMELLGEKWNMLIIREILLGGTRFNELQKGLPGISPTLLTKRLVQMEEEELILKKKIPGQRGYEYFPTEACNELFPVMEQIGIWGMRWSRHQMKEDDFDVELLMLHLERSILPEKLVGNETVIKFHFTDSSEYPNWWVVVTGDDIDVCIHDPGKEVDVYLTTTVRTMTELWMGDITYRRAIKDKKLALVGPKTLTKAVDEWIKPSIFAGLQPASQILD